MSNFPTPFEKDVLYPIYVFGAFIIKIIIIGAFIIKIIIKNFMICNYVGVFQKFLFH
jgi:hypothetical protein